MASQIEQKYASLGGASSFLGTPTLPEELTTPDGIGRYRHYQGGSIYWSPSTDAHEVHGYIGGKWAELGWERSFLGYPITDELPSGDALGRYSRFQHGLIYWTSSGGALPLANPIRNISLVREQSKPEVYFICGGAKLWIPNPHEFEIVGFRWDSIQVVPDGALDGYRRNFFSAPALVKPSDVFFDCGETFDSVTGRWRFNCQSSKNLIRKNVVVAGWLTLAAYINNTDDGGIEKPEGVEDIFYNIALDPDFVDRMYGPSGLSSSLNDAAYPGNPFVPDNPLPFGDLAPDGSSRGVTCQSFILPTWSPDIHGELNAWHVDNTGSLFTRHFVGRGPAPGGWWRIPFGNDTNVWWPWNVMNPDDGSRLLQVGDYVIMKGALWQDGMHGDGYVPEKDPWQLGRTRGHIGWTEIHPVDWIVRVSEPKLASRKTASCMTTLVDENTSGPFDLQIDPPNDVGSKKYVVGEIGELIDGRITDMSDVSNYSTMNQGTHVKVKGTLNGPSGRQGRFRATYIVEWRENDSRDTKWFDDELPNGVTPHGDGEGWNWVTMNPVPFSGTKAHQSNSVMGVHQHFFDGATSQLAVNVGETLFTYIYLDPNDPPFEVMLQWHEGSWDHRAYWGANAISWGADGTFSRRRIGELPEPGAWVRLEVPASLVNLEGKTVNGMAFTLFGGKATWGRTGKWSPPPTPARLAVSVTPNLIKLRQSQQVTVRVEDANTHVLIPSAVVHIHNFAKVGHNAIDTQHPANAPFAITFYPKGTFDPRTHKWDYDEMPSGTVRAPNYPQAVINFEFESDL